MCDGRKSSWFSDSRSAPNCGVSICRGTGQSRQPVCQGLLRDLFSFERSCNQHGPVVIQGQCIDWLRLSGPPGTVESPWHARGNAGGVVGSPDFSVAAVPITAPGALAVKALVDRSM